MGLFLKIAPLGFMLIGLVFIIISQKMRTVNHPPVPSFNVKHWKPIWMMKDWFTPKGFKFHMTGWTLFIIGAIISAFNYSN